MIVELTIVALVVASGYIEPVWRVLLERYDEYTMVVGGMFISLVAGYFIGALPYTILDALRLQAMEKYKTQQDKYPNARDQVKTAASLMALFVFVMLPMIAMGAPFFKLMGMRRDLPLPQWHVVVVQVVFFFVVEDYLNYWFHRWLHTPWAYKHIHSWHHEHSAPYGLTATFAHPLEVVILGVPTFTGPLLVGPHLLTLWIWLMMRQYEAIDIHSGYEFPWNINSYLTFYAGTEHHDYHHFMYSGNFASVFTWCDRLYQTNLGYEVFKAKKHVQAKQ